MKAVILAGGFGTRISEETHLKPKPMIEIGGRPILWHLLKIFGAHGINEFIICCGYKGYVIKEYFANYFLHMSDVTFDLNDNSMKVHRRSAEPWKITLVDTGESTMTGGRLRRVSEYLGDETFCFTYGDGLANIDLTQLVNLHRTRGKLATVTAVQPPGRFGALQFSPESLVTSFQEKPHGDGSWVSGGFFILEPQVIEYLQDDSTVWEQQPLQEIASAGQLNAYFHQDFWHPMDTLRDRQYLQELWAQGKAPWKIW